MLDFAFVDLCPNLSHQKQRFRFRPAIIQIGTKNKPTSNFTA